MAKLFFRSSGLTKHKTGLRDRNQNLGGNQVYCAFRCPARGYIDFPVWPRKGEGPHEACRRRLKALVDEAQVPLCEETSVRRIDGAKTRRIRSHTMGLPRVKIVRED